MRNLWNAGNPWAIWAIWEESMKCWQSMSNLWAIYEQSIYCCHIILPCIKNLWGIYNESIYCWQSMSNIWAIYEESMSNMRANLLWIYEQYEQSIYCCHIILPCIKNLWGIYNESIYCWQSMSNVRGIYILLSHYAGNIWAIYEQYESQSMSNLWNAGNLWGIWGIYEQYERNLWAIY
jgi:hypothetical protein